MQGNVWNSRPDLFLVLSGIPDLLLVLQTTGFDNQENVLEFQTAFVVKMDKVWNSRQIPDLLLEFQTIVFVNQGNVWNSRQPSSLSRKMSGIPDTREKLVWKTRLICWVRSLSGIPDLFLVSSGIPDLLLVFQTTGCDNQENVWNSRQPLSSRWKRSGIPDRFQIFSWNSGPLSSFTREMSGIPDSLRR